MIDLKLQEPYKSFFAILGFYLLGSILAIQLKLSIIFYGNYVIDWIISFFIIVIAVLLTRSFIKPKSDHWTMAPIVFVFLVVHSGQIELYLYSYSDTVTFVSYSILAVATFFCTIPISHEEAAKDPSKVILLLLGFLMGGLIEYLMGNKFIVYSASAIYLIMVWFQISRSKALFRFVLSISIIALVLSYQFSEPPIIYESQKKYHDKVIFSHTTPFQKIDVTSWKGHHWFYQNNINQFSSIDEWLYSEPMVHPAMSIIEKLNTILVIGGENGIILKEILKYGRNINIEMLALDTAYLRIASTNRLFTGTNKNALSDPRVKFEYGNPFGFLVHQADKYDLIFVDVPDPTDIEVNQYYTKEFYELCNQSLKPHGIIVTQAGSPYFATKAFYAIRKAMEAGGFNTIPYHNQILTLGEWGWHMGSKSSTSPELKRTLLSADFSKINSTWISGEAMQMMLSFGKPQDETDMVEVNTLKNPTVLQYYRSGTWSF